MTVGEWIRMAVVSLVVVLVWLAAERLGNRWWQALPDAIREKGLIRWFFQRKQGPGSHDPQSTSKPASKRLT